MNRKERRRAEAIARGLKVGEEVARAELIQRLRAMPCSHDPSAHLSLTLADGSTYDFPRCWRCGLLPLVDRGDPADFLAVVVVLERSVA